mgnify:CR=1 FL=1
MSPVISHPRSAAARHQSDELSPITITVDCPAKTNLTLEVGPAHDEWGGRHELDTIYCAIGVYDTVTATAKQPGAGFSLELEGAYLGDLASSRNDMRRNHAVLALFAMAQAAEREPDVALTITKRIPVGAGLGGGSADAAATMLAVNRLWELNWPIERLRTIAATLGADMPFCLTGGLAYGTGFGERITDIAPGSRDELALIEQGFSGEVLVGAYQSQLSTPEVYHTFDIVGAAEGDRNHLQAAAISLHPRSGQVLVDGVDVREYSLKNLRDGVGMVLQKNVLFSGTIDENLRWGNEEASEEAIQLWSIVLFEPNLPNTPISASDSDAKVATSHPTHERSPPMTYQVDEREARKAYVRRRQTIVFSISGAVLAVVLVIALLFNFHVFGLGEVETPASQPNYGNAAPCAVKDSSGKAQYVSNASVGIRVMNGTSHGQFAKAVGEALANRGFSVQKIDNYSSTDVERTTIYFGKNAINQAYTLIGNFTDATMIMTAREDQLIDVVIGATFNDLQDTNSSPQSGKTITNIEGCKAADSMTKLPADTKHDAYTAQ